MSHRPHLARRRQHMIKVIFLAQHAQDGCGIDLRGRQRANDW
jgi:hypothetical protein